MARTRYTKTPEIPQGREGLLPQQPGEGSAPPTLAQAGSTLPGGPSRAARDWWSPMETAALAAVMTKVPSGMLPGGEKACKALEALVGRQADFIREKRAALLSHSPLRGSKQLEWPGSDNR